jgi:hypothetical protein
MGKEGGFWQFWGLSNGSGSDGVSQKRAMPDRNQRAGGQKKECRGVELIDTMY